MGIRNEIFAARLLQQFSDIRKIFVTELWRILRDPGVVTIFFIAGLLYPILYKVLYWNEQAYEIPVAVVDLSCSSDSRRLLHKWNATPDVSIAYQCQNMEEAEMLMKEQKIHGILYIPTDYAYHIQTTNGQARISLYCDMSTFLYMKGIYMSMNKVMLDEMHAIQMDRFERSGFGQNTSWVLTQGAPYDEVALFCPSGGYSSFIIPPVLMLILHQTLLLGICMLAGTAREENETLFFLPGRRRRRGAMRIIFGRSLAYLLIYYILSMILLIIYPRILNIPHISNPLDILLFITPFLLSTIFFSMTASLFVRNRETGMVLFITTSLIFLFISGISWPEASVPELWKMLGRLIPSTWGIQGFVHMNTMGATIHQVAHEYGALWILSGVYFLTASIGLMLQGILTDPKARQETRHSIYRYMMD